MKWGTRTNGDTTPATMTYAAITAAVRNTNSTTSTEGDAR